MRETAHTIVAIASLSSIAVGAWWLSPAVSLIAVGSLLLAGIVYSRTVPRGKQ